MQIPGATRPQRPARWFADACETGSIGKRYRRQDEIGTPKAITIDFETLEADPKDAEVTIRDRDTMEQEKVKITDLIGKLAA